MTKKQKENLAMKEWAEANSNYIEDQYVIYFNDQKYAKKWEYPGNMLIDSNKPNSIKKFVKFLWDTYDEGLCGKTPSKNEFDQIHA